MNEQISLFDLLAAAASPAPARTEDVHWLVVTTRRAGTACGEVVATYSHPERSAVMESGRRLACSVDRFSPSISCPGCKERMW